MRVMAALSLIGLMALAGAANAQNDVCMDQNGNIDQTVTEGWQRFQANANPQVMQAIVGTWYSEVANQFNTGQINYRYTTFEPSGLFTVQSKVCVNGNYCSDFPGHGFWAAQQQNGVLVMMTIYSDTHHTNYCNYTQFQMPDAFTMMDNTGFTSRRVQ